MKKKKIQSPQKSMYYTTDLRFIIKPNRPNKDIGSNKNCGDIIKEVTKIWLLYFVKTSAFLLLYPTLYEGA